VVAIGPGVERVAVGERVYAYGFEGGFCAQYVAVKEEETAIVPPNLPTEEAGALGVDGVTALIGLEEKLKAGPFHVELGRTYPLEEAAQAHRAVGQHHLGKLALRFHAHGSGAPPRRF